MNKRERLEAHIKRLWETYHWEESLESLLPELPEKQITRCVTGPLMAKLHFKVGNSEKKLMSIFELLPIRPGDTYTVKTQKLPDPFTTLLVDVEWVHDTGQGLIGVNVSYSVIKNG